jgi:hypothetical protein
MVSPVESTGSWRNANRGSKLPPVDCKRIVRTAGGTLDATKVLSSKHHIYSISTDVATFASTTKKMASVPDKACKCRCANEKRNRNVSSASCCSCICLLQQRSQKDPCRSLPQRRVLDQAEWLISDVVIFGFRSTKTRQPEAQE